MTPQKKKPIPQVTLTMSPSAARLSLRAKVKGNSRETQYQDLSEGNETRGFPSPLFNGFGFVEDRK